MNEFKMVVEDFKSGQAKLAESVIHISNRLSNVQEQVGRLTEGQIRLETDTAVLKAGQVRLETRMDKLEAGQARLEVGQTKLEAGQKEIKAELKNKVQVGVVDQLTKCVTKLEHKAA